MPNLKKILPIQTVPKEHCYSIYTRQHNHKLDWAKIEESLIFVTAPPGYGKTTLIEQWQRTLHTQGRTSALVNLTKYANHTPILLDTIKQILNIHEPLQCVEDLKNLIQTGAITPPDAILFNNADYLTNDSSAAVIDALFPLARYGTKIVVAGRSVKNFSVSSLLLNQQAKIIDASALTLSMEELDLLVKDYFPNNISDIHTTSLYKELNGFPAAIFCYFRKTKIESDSENSHNSKIACIKKLLNGYFTEILNQYKPTQQWYLKACSSLEQFDAKDLSYLTNQENIHEHINIWLRDNLFITATSSGKVWKLLPLFRDYLCQRLHEENPEMVNKLHNRAYQFALKQHNKKINPHSSYPTAQKQQVNHKPKNDPANFNQTEFTDQERKVLLQIVLGKRNKDIASLMEISEGTVKWHVHNLYKKMHVRSRSQAIIKANQLRIAF